MWRLYILTLFYIGAETTLHTRNTTEDWDILIFTQSWPNTVCLQWEEHAENHTCLPLQRKNKWTIHGIWPTIYGTHRPSYCNPTWKFDETKIADIENELNIYWPNIQNGSSKTSLWQHEWEKHGTCAASLPDLDSEEKYFKQGLMWVKQYDLSKIMSQSGINPSYKELTLQELANAVKMATKKNPEIQCYGDTATKEEYLMEIRICFDKKLELIDCDGIKPLGIQKYNVLTNCPLKKGVVYPSLVPPEEHHKRSGYENNKKEESWIFTLLKVVTYLQWFTL